MSQYTVISVDTTNQLTRHKHILMLLSNNIIGYSTKLSDITNSRPSYCKQTFTLQRPIALHDYES